MYNSVPKTLRVRPTAKNLNRFVIFGTSLIVPAMAFFVLLQSEGEELLASGFVILVDKKGNNLVTKN